MTTGFWGMYFGYIVQVQAKESKITYITGGSNGIMAKIVSAESKKNDKELS